MRHHENGERRTNEWKDEVLNALIVNFAYEAEHETNPRKALADLISWEVQVALDPMVSSDARTLIDEGREEIFAEIAVLRRAFGKFAHDYGADEGSELRLLAEECAREYVKSITPVATIPL